MAPVAPLWRSFNARNPWRGFFALGAIALFINFQLFGNLKTSLAVRNNFKGQPVHLRHSFNLQVMRSKSNLLRPRAEKEDDDFVTKIFTGLFGKNARDDPEPLGLKRATVEDFPDLWPPTQELGEALPGDSAEVAKFRPYLKQTKLEKEPLILAYDAERDGWSNAAFRKAMDGSYAAVLVGETTGGAKIGAYNPAGWLGYGDFRECISAFLFTWPDGDVSKDAVKLPKVGGPGMAIIDEGGKGPQWGPDGLKINLDSRSGISRLGSYYQRMPNGGTSIFTKEEGNKAEIKAIQIYVAKDLSDAAKDYEPKFTQWG